MNIVFMGTPEFAIPSFQALLESVHQVVGVVTVPDKPTGRGLKITPSPVKQLALDYNLPLLQPEKLTDEDFIRQLSALKADLFVLVAFRILPEAVFTMPPRGTVNLHASLLPRYRGAAPINWALINGETETGITIFFIKKEIDTGNIILQEKVEILPEDNFGSLHNKLMTIGAEVLMEAIDLIEANEAPSLPQTGEVTKAPRITKEICRINWDNPALSIHNLVRGLSPCPGAFTMLDNRLLKIFTTQYVNQPTTLTVKPGTIIEISQKTGLISVVTGDGTLAIQELQLAGKKCMCTSEFLKGCRLKVGDQFV